MQIIEITGGKKGKHLVKTDVGISFPLYTKELQKYELKDACEISEELWHTIRKEVLDPRATKRVLHLLEKMDRTRQQLVRKLTENGYPEEVICRALEYAESFHYIDDRRYAENYIRFHQQEKSRLQLKTSLLQKGVSGDDIEAALEEAYEVQEEELIRKFLVKKHYDPEMDLKERQKVFQYLMRKGFSAGNIRRCMAMDEI